MKKLMIALAAVAMAAGVQAANVKWQVTSDATGKDLMVYVCDPTKVPAQIAAAEDISGYLLGSPVNTGTLGGSRNIGRTVFSRASPMTSRVRRRPLHSSSSAPMGRAIGRRLVRAKSTRHRLRLFRRKRR